MEPPTKSTNQRKGMTEAFNHCLLGPFFWGKGNNRAISFCLVRLRRLSPDFCTLQCWLQGRRNYVALAGFVWSPRSHRHPRDAETDRHKQSAHSSLLKIRPQIRKYNIFKDLQIQSVEFWTSCACAQDDFRVCPDSRCQVLSNDKTVIFRCLTFKLSRLQLVKKDISEQALLCILFFPCRDCCFIAYWLHGDGGANFQSWNIMHPCKRWRSLTLVRWLFSSTTSPLIGFTHRPHNGRSTAVQSWSLFGLDEALKLNEAAWDCHNAKKRKENDRRGIHKDPMTPYERNTNSFWSISVCIQPPRSSKGSKGLKSLVKSLQYWWPVRPPDGPPGADETRETWDGTGYPCMLYNVVHINMYMRRVHHLPTHLYICLSIHPSLSFCTIHGKSSPAWKLTLCPGQLLQPPVSFIMEAPEQWQLPQRKPYLVVDGDFWVYTDGLNVHYEVIQSGNSAFSWFYRMTDSIYTVCIYSIYIRNIMQYVYIYAYTSLGASGQRRPAWTSNFAQAEGLLGENPGWRRLGPSAGLHCSQLLQWVAEMGFGARLHWSSWTQFLGCYSGNSHFASWTLALSSHGWYKNPSVSQELLNISHVTNGSDLPGEQSMPVVRCEGALASLVFMLLLGQRFFSSLVLWQSGLS